MECKKQKTKTGVWCFCAWLTKNARKASKKIASENSRKMMCRLAKAHKNISLCLSAWAAAAKRKWNDKKKHSRLVMIITDKITYVFRGAKQFHKRICSVMENTETGKQFHTMFGLLMLAGKRTHRVESVKTYGVLFLTFKFVLCACG